MTVLSDTEERAAAVRTAVLKHAHHHPMPGPRRWFPAKLIASCPEYQMVRGEPVAEDEAVQAVLDLEDEGLLERMGFSGGRQPVSVNHARFRLNAAGRRCASRYGGDIEAFRAEETRAMTVQVNTASGGGSVCASVHGDAHQHSAGALSPADLAALQSLVADLRVLAQSMGPEQAGELTGLADDLGDTLQAPGPRPRSLRTRLQSTLRFLHTEVLPTTANAAGAIAGIQALLPTLG
ncbi:hypothetical protein [Streptomyces spectabilis]|uniref:Uncharacterized protein n=1 Tax=Streptomyces spectabilis TaxID=68270 RepID=A0A7W8B4M7_STRST|nr:hypothetical protein [Streptomyces spectabilis]MBB5109641.1 hypothetical protein [Streptomyces spectabilis]GGV54903.1 hypothetical protein GCM10010245_86860 [Streptomyces spectabilis]